MASVLVEKAANVMASFSASSESAVTVGNASSASATWSRMVVEGLEGLMQQQQEWTMAGIWDSIHDCIMFVLVDFPMQVWNAVPRDAVVPLLVIVIVFWPLLVSLLYAFMTASTWMIWLLTSLILGILQVLYVSYQFVMITLDLCGLSLFKSYSTARNLVLTHVLAIKKKSRRRLWQEKLKNAGSYENFLKIRIEPKEMATLEETANGSSHNRGGSTSFFGRRSEAHANSSMAQSEVLKRDPALPPLRPVPTRSNSFDGKRLTNRRTDAASTDTGSSSTLSSTTASTNVPRVRSSGHISNMLFRHQPLFSTSLEDFMESETQEPANVEEKKNDNSLVDPIVSEELGERAAYLLVTTTERLSDARRQAERCANNGSREDEEEAWNRLKYLLSAVVKRNHLHLDNVLLENARTVSFAGRYGLTSQSRQIIRAFYEQVQKGLDLLADGPALQCSSNQSNSSAKDAQQSQLHPSLLPKSTHDAETSYNDGTASPRSSTSSISLQQEHQNEELSDRLRVLRKMKQNMGRTALMLSGGGAQAMYHIGIIRALIQSKLYSDISVISGTSGGSIIAAMCALKTPEELFTQVCVNTVSTDFTMDGEQKRKNIRWFPSPMEMASYWFKHKYLVSSEEFRRTCHFYYGTTTFEEAFDRTGKNVCITVSASRTSGDSASQRLLLNHISTPRVTLASAVAASCALPGVMAPAKLLTKNSMGELEPFEVDGVEWIDGSVQADLPFQRIATLFAVSNFIVSQTNFHIVPLLNKDHHPNQNSLYWRLFQTMEWDIRSRALKLSRLGLFPRIFGQDISKVFKQKYHGNLTIVPRFTTMQTFGLHALSNPTVEDMKNYIKYGEIATWPYLNAIRDMIRLEKVIDDCLNRLEQRLGTLNPEWYDDIESITSSNYHHSSSLRCTVSTTPHHAAGGTTILSLPSSNSASQRVVKYGRTSTNVSLNSNSRNGGDEKIRRKAKKLEEENKALKEKLQQLQQLLHGSGIEMDKERDNGNGAAVTQS